ncbi:class I SAM-dependent methyltransferase [Agromyces sp. MMS24-JH15]|uniref:class I SAM-dependent methyltransferase n=1 Tax=Agromyces sp. MMS24-JH15 TaxID=3243765 RepID=UPI00374A2105
MADSIPLDTDGDDVVAAEPEGPGPATPADDPLDHVLWNPVSMATVLRSHPQFDESVLDACSGTGASALPAAELVGPLGRVDAIDVDPDAIAVLRERAGTLLPQLRAEVADATAWAPDGYDLVQCVLGVHLFEDVEGGVRHLIERTRPGGRVVLTVWSGGALAPIPAALAAAVAAETAPVEDAPVEDAPADAEPGDAEGTDDPAPTDDAAVTDDAAITDDSGPTDDSGAPDDSAATDSPESTDAPDTTAAEPEASAPRSPIGLPQAETPGALALWLADLGLQEVRAESIGLHLALDAELAWHLVTGTGLRRELDGLDDAARERVRADYLADLEAQGVSTVDASTLIAVGHRPEPSPEADEPSPEADGQDEADEADESGDQDESGGPDESEPRAD